MRLLQATDTFYARPNFGPMMAARKRAARRCIAQFGDEAHGSRRRQWLRSRSGPSQTPRFARHRECGWACKLPGRMSAAQMRRVRILTADHDVLNAHLLRATAEIHIYGRTRPRRAKTRRAFLRSPLHQDLADERAHDQRAQVGDEREHRADAGDEDEAAEEAERRAVEDEVPGHPTL